MKIKFFLLALFLAAAFYRVSFVNHPFWVDEFSSAIQARLINTYGLVNFFKQTDYYAEPNNILPHILIANSFRHFGETESAARLPFMIIGSLVPLAVFLLARLLFDTCTGIISSLLATTSYFMITWSRQARGYPLQQLLVLLLIFSYIQYNKTKHLKWLIYLVILAIVGVFTHYFITLLVGILVILFIIENGNMVKKHWLSLSIGIILVGIGAYFTNILQNASATFFSTVITQSTNNLWYYHSLLWREETVITLLSVVGIIWAYSNGRKYLWQLLLITAFLLSLIVFIIPAYSSRYLLLVFPLFLLFASYAITQISQVVMSNLKLVGLTTPLAIALTLFIIGSGHMFTIQPQPYYSVNHTMRDIALVDYEEVYAEIIDSRVFYSDIAVIDTWADRAHWYLGQEYENLYWFRWLDEKGSINGLPLKTNTVTGPSGDLLVPLSGPRLIPLVSSQADLERVMSVHSKGYIWIDDSSMPTDVIAYAEQNFREVITVDHYSLDDNPYSIWPGTLYSWGINPASASATPAQP